MTEHDFLKPPLNETTGNHGTGGGFSMADSDPDEQDRSGETDSGNARIIEIMTLFEECIKNYIQRGGARSPVESSYVELVTALQQWGKYSQRPMPQFPDGSVQHLCTFSNKDTAAWHEVELWLGDLRRLVMGDMLVDVPLQEPPRDPGLQNSSGLNMW